MAEKIYHDNLKTESPLLNSTGTPSVEATNNAQSVPTFEWDQYLTPYNEIEKGEQAIVEPTKKVETPTTPTESPLSPLAEAPKEEAKVVPMEFDIPTIEGYRKKPNAPALTTAETSKVSTPIRKSHQNYFDEYMDVAKHNFALTQTQGRVSSQMFGDIAKSLTPEAMAQSFGDISAMRSQAKQYADAMSTTATDFGIEKTLSELMSGWKSDKKLFDADEILSQIEKTDGDGNKFYQFYGGEIYGDAARKIVKRYVDEHNHWVNMRDKDYRERWSMAQYGIPYEEFVDGRYESVLKPILDELEEKANAYYASEEYKVKQRYGWVGDVPITSSDDNLALELGNIKGMANSFKDATFANGMLEGALPAIKNAMALGVGVIMDSTTMAEQVEALDKAYKGESLSPREEYLVALWQAKEMIEEETNLYRKGANWAKTASMGIQGIGFSAGIATSGAQQIGNMLGRKLLGETAEQSIKKVIKEEGFKAALKMTAKAAPKKIAVSTATSAVKAGVSSMTARNFAEDRLDQFKMTKLGLMKEEKNPLASLWKAYAMSFGEWFTEDLGDVADDILSLGRRAALNKVFSGKMTKALTRLDDFKATSAVRSFLRDARIQGLTAEAGSELLNNYIQPLLTGEFFWDISQDGFMSAANKHYSDVLTWESTWDTITQSAIIAGTGMMSRGISGAIQGWQISSLRNQIRETLGDVQNEGLRNQLYELINSDTPNFTPLAGVNWKSEGINVEDAQRAMQVVFKSAQVQEMRGEFEETQRLAAFAPQLQYILQRAYKGVDIASPTETLEEIEIKKGDNIFGYVLYGDVDSPNQVLQIVDGNGQIHNIATESLKAEGYEFDRKSIGDAISEQYALMFSDQISQERLGDVIESVRGCRFADAETKQRIIEANGFSVYKNGAAVTLVDGRMAVVKGNAENGQYTVDILGADGKVADTAMVGFEYILNENDPKMAQAQMEAQARGALGSPIVLPTKDGGRISLDEINDSQTLADLLPSQVGGKAKAVAVIDAEIERLKAMQGGQSKKVGLDAVADNVQQAEVIANRIAVLEDTRKRLGGAPKAQPKTREEVAKENEAKQAKRDGMSTFEFSQDYRRRMGNTKISRNALKTFINSIDGELAVLDETLKDNETAIAKKEAEISNAFSRATSEADLERIAEEQETAIAKLNTLKAERAEMEADRKNMQHRKAQYEQTLKDMGGNTDTKYQEGTVGADKRVFDFAKKASEILGMPVVVSEKAFTSNRQNGIHRVEEDGKRAIYINPNSTAAEQGVGILAHEIGHEFKKVLTPEEWAKFEDLVLTARFGKDWVNSEAYKKEIEAIQNAEKSVNGQGISDAKAREEAVTYALQTFIFDGERGARAFEAIIRKHEKSDTLMGIWRKIVDKLKEVFSFFEDKNVKEAIDEFEKIFNRYAQEMKFSTPDQDAKDAVESAKAENETSSSLALAELLESKSEKYHQNHTTNVSAKTLVKANEDINAMVEVMRPYIDQDMYGASVLPKEVYGKGMSTIFKNQSYGASMENTTICLRTLAYIEFVDDVKEKLGRPLTTEESFLASQMLYDIATDPQCLYCYVSLDRKAYDESFLSYLRQRDDVLKMYDAIEGRKTKSAIEEIYQTFLGGRKDTPPMKARFNMWIDAHKKGLPMITASELRNTKSIEEAEQSGDANLVKQINDAKKYAQSASWAKKIEDYRAYTGELLKISDKMYQRLNNAYGLRFYSFSEYTPAFIVENMQMMRDASLKGLRGLAYTKEVEFAKIFAPTNANINISIFGRRDADGNMVMDTRQGADWNEAQALREQYPNVGLVFVATNDADVEWALAQDFIDVVIPFHIVRTGSNIADFYEWTNYKNMQEDKGGKSILPNEHNNDKETFLRLAEERGLTPRFSKWVDNPNYMKLVNETRRASKDTPFLQPIFNLDEAKASFKAFVDKGGYFGGWYNVDEQGYQDGVEQVYQDILAGKTAKDVDYGRQDVPADDLNTKRKVRQHNNVVLRSSNSLQKQPDTQEVVSDADVVESYSISRNKKSAFETALPEDEASFKGTAISSTDGAKILKNIDNTIDEYEKRNNNTRNFIGDIADALDIEKTDRRSKYKTIETKNGRTISLRVSDHNATVKNFDDHNEEYGISIVISRKDSEGITNNGNAHLVEYFYSDAKLQRADGKPLVEILKSLKQTLYSGEYNDTTGLAVREEVNESFSISRNNEAVIDKWLGKREDFTDEVKSAFKEFIAEFKPATQLATTKWFANGVIRIPEDMPKVEQAMEIAQRKKVDALQFNSPMELIDQFGDVFKPKEKLINPDDVPTLTNKVQVPNTDITIYDVEDSEESRVNFRNLMNSHLGKDANPWCLMQAEDGVLTNYSARYWSDYSKYQRRAAFKNGKLVAFFASADAPTWWDRLDSPYSDIPVTSKIKGDALGRTATTLYSEEDGSIVGYTNIHKGKRWAEESTYEGWHDLDTKAEESNYDAVGDLLNRRVWDENGELVQERLTEGNLKIGVNYENGVKIYESAKVDDQDNEIVNRTWSPDGNLDNISWGVGSQKMEYWYDVDHAVSSIYRDAEHIQFLLSGTKVRYKGGSNTARAVVFDELLETERVYFYDGVAYEKDYLPKFNSIRYTLENITIDGAFVSFNVYFSKATGKEAIMIYHNGQNIVEMQDGDIVYQDENIPLGFIDNALEKYNEYLDKVDIIISEKLEEANALRKQAEDGYAKFANPDTDIRELFLPEVEESFSIDRSQYLEGVTDDYERRWAEAKMNAVDSYVEQGNPTKIGVFIRSYEVFAKKEERRAKREKLDSRKEAALTLVKIYNGIADYAYAVLEKEFPEYIANTQADNIKSGNATLGQIRDLFEKYNSNEELVELFNLVFDVANKFGTKVRFATIKNAGEARGNLITYDVNEFNSRSIENQRKASILLHEMIHAVTTEGIRWATDPRFQEVVRQRPSIQLQGAARRLTKLLNSIRNNAAFKGEYGTTDVYEMLAELSNPMFVAKLKSHNLWTRIVDGIRDIVVSIVSVIKGKDYKTNAHAELRNTLTEVLEEIPISFIDYINAYRDVELLNKKKYEADSSSAEPLTETESFSILRDEDTDTIFATAKEEFASTNDWIKTGWLMPDGTQLDFAEGGDYRGTDHRAIGAAYKGTAEHQWQYLQDFENRGGIRIHMNMDGKYGTLEMSVKPTADQKKKLRSFIGAVGGNVDVDFMDENYNTVHSVSYDGVSPARVLSGITSFYDEGIKPKGNVSYSVDRLNKRKVEKGFGGIWIADKQEFAKFASAVRTTPHEEDGEGIAFTDNYFYAYYRNIDGQPIPYASVYMNRYESQDVVDEVNKVIANVRKGERAKFYFDRAVVRFRTIQNKDNANNGDNQSASHSVRTPRMVRGLLRKGRYYVNPHLYVKTQRADIKDYDEIDTTSYSINRTDIEDLDATNRVDAERKEIEDKAKADGTWLKAPNGKDTNLSSKQWVDVRTKAFKEWFGDWESNAEITVMQERITKWLAPDNLQKAQGKSKNEILDLFGNDLEPIAYIPIHLLPILQAELTDNRIYSGKGYMINHAVNHHPNLSAEKYKNIQSVINDYDEIKETFTNGRRTVIFIKKIDRYNAVLVQVGSNDKGQLIFHKSFFEQKKEPYAKLNSIRPELSLEGGVSSISHTNFVPGISLDARNDIANIKRNFVIPNNSSKIVDENGEPKVVYHQTNGTVYINRETGENWDELDWQEKDAWDERDDWDEYWEEQDFYTFSRVNARTTNELDGFFFAPEYDEYHEYGERTIPAFLNIRRPASKEDYMVDATYNNAGRKERIRMQNEGYDGVVYVENDGRVVEYIAFEPNQIKSADPITYDNEGNIIPLSERFNTKNDDIRYSLNRDDVTIATPEMVAEANEELSKEAKLVAELDVAQNTIDRMVRKLNAVTERKEMTFDEVKAFLLDSDTMSGLQEASAGQYKRIIRNVLNVLEKTPNKRIKVESLANRIQEEMLSARLNIADSLLEVAGKDFKKLITKKREGRNSRGESIAKYVDNETRKAVELFVKAIEYAYTDAKGKVKWDNALLAGRAFGQGITTIDKILDDDEINGETLPTQTRNLLFVYKFLRDRAVEADTAINNGKSTAANIREVEAELAMLKELVATYKSGGRNFGAALRELKSMGYRTIDAAERAIEYTTTILKSLRKEMRDYKSEEARAKKQLVEAIKYMNTAILGVDKKGRVALKEELAKKKEKQGKFKAGIFRSVRSPHYKNVGYKEEYIDEMSYGKRRNLRRRGKVFWADVAETFEFLSRRIDRMSIPNEWLQDGWYYQFVLHPTEGVLARADWRYKNEKALREQLNEKARELFAPDKKKGKFTIDDLKRRLKAKTGIEIETIKTSVTGKPQHKAVKQTIELTLGQLLYIRAMNAQEGGILGLMTNGLNPNMVARIVATTESRFPEFCEFDDWIRGEDGILEQIYAIRNEIYRKINGVDLDHTEGYFPIQRLSDEVHKEEDVGNTINVATIAGGIGSNKKRVRNSVPIDITVDYFEKLDKHISESIQWCAAAELIDKMNVLLSSKQFRQILEAQYFDKEAIKNSYKRAIGERLMTTEGKQTDVDRIVNSVAKNFVASNVTSNLNSALKQLVSLSASFSNEISPMLFGYFARNIFVPSALMSDIKDMDLWNKDDSYFEKIVSIAKLRGVHRWAKENIPTYAERVDSENMGYDIFEQDGIDGWDKISGWFKGKGMAANVFMDSVACAVLAKTYYDYQYQRNKDKGMSHQEAHDDARMRAANIMNQTQQSSQGAYMSKYQADKLIGAQAVARAFFMAYQNSQLGFDRNARAAYQNLATMMYDMFGKEKGASMKLMIKYQSEQYIARGIEKSKARKMAVADYRRSFFTQLNTLLHNMVLNNVLWNASRVLSANIARMMAVVGLAFRGSDYDDDSTEITFEAIWDDVKQELRMSWIYALPYTQTIAAKGFVDTIVAATTATNANSFKAQHSIGGQVINDLLGSIEKAITSFDYASDEEKKAQMMLITLGTLDALSRAGLGISTRTLIRMLGGVVGIAGDGEAEHYMNLFSSPRYLTKAVAGRPRKGETMDQYTERLGGAYKIINGNFKGEDTSKLRKQYIDRMDELMFYGTDFDYDAFKELEKWTKRKDARLPLKSDGTIREGVSAPTAEEAWRQMQMHAQKTRAYSFKNTLQSYNNWDEEGAKKRKKFYEKQLNALEAFKKISETPQEELIPVVSEITYQQTYGDYLDNNINKWGYKKRTESEIERRSKKAARKIASDMEEYITDYNARLNEQNK